MIGVMTFEVKAIRDEASGLVYGVEAKYSADQPREESGRFGVSGSGGARAGKPFAVIDTHDPQGGKGMRRVSFHATAAEAQGEAKKLNERNQGKHTPGAIHIHGTTWHKHEALYDPFTGKTEPKASDVGHTHSGGRAKIGGARSPSNHGFDFTPDMPPSRKV
jgi:hypothetical protein